LTRRPSPEERNVLLQFYRQTLTDLVQMPQAARELAGVAPDREQAELPRDLSHAELAAWTAVCRVLLNLDETITKE
jgi:hypothetical protein